MVQGALKLILEPIFEADFQEGSYGYRPKRTAHAAVDRVADAVVHHKTRIIDRDLRAYFDTVRPDRLWKQVAQPVQEAQVLRVLKQILKASGKRGVPQGGVLSPLLSNLYLNAVDKRLEKAKATTRNGSYTDIEYARWADDRVILVDGYRKWEWLEKAVYRRLMEELAQLDLQVNEAKTRRVDLTLGDRFGFLGFDFRRVKTLQEKWGVQITPKKKARTLLLQKLKDIFRRWQSQPLEQVIELINPILRGWVNYFRIGHAQRCFGYGKDWVEKKVRRHWMRARQRKGFGWNRWSKDWLYPVVGLYADYAIRYYQSPKARPAG